MTIRRLQLENFTFLLQPVRKAEVKVCFLIKSPDTCKRGKLIAIPFRGLKKFIRSHKADATLAKHISEMKDAIIKLWQMK
ncbi:hypothetical protein O6P43_016704 [Quillaja saponaria]|uniref:Uncharacterized protein n=1 Tax=Quillaja saponaria TaxID=32244 RepID=A0AAD7PNQ1_QUISA|nr:hypothetical protein O6P43_016704 [Quillaja saponaria]